jgi:hypothetical protein
MPKKRRKRSQSATWRRPRNMPLSEWEQINEKTEAEIIAWARTLTVEDEDGHLRKLTEAEVLQVAKAGHWEGSARAARKKG